MNMGSTSTSLLLLPYCRTSLSLFLLISLLPPAKMPRKVRKTKGHAKIKEFYRINKKIGNERRHYPSLSIKIIATNKYLY